MKICIFSNAAIPAAAFLTILPFSSAAEISSPELPAAMKIQRGETDSLLLEWPTVAGQKYRLESSPTLGQDAVWSPVAEEVEAEESSMSREVAVDRQIPQRFYRLSVQGEDFEPESLQPLWQLDAQKDFSPAMEGQPVSQWNGTGISSAVQSIGDRRPVLKDGAVVFDGINDHIALPMWAQGVGKQWTLSVLMRLHRGAKDLHVPFGGDFAANRALELIYSQGGVYRFSPGYATLIDQAHSVFTGNDDWKVVTVRYDGTSTKLSIDWYQGEIESPSAETGATGVFNIGCGFDPEYTALPVDIRYMSFFTTCLSDKQVAKMGRWMEKKKDGEFPPVALFYGSGQSNFYTTQDDLRRQLTTSFGNAAFAFGDHYSGTPLINWMKDKDDEPGFELCPLYDLNEAPASSGAHAAIGLHSGVYLLDRWKLKASAVKKNPRTMTACVFVQGENDTNDATQIWKPNNRKDYNLTCSDPDEFALTYGDRAIAWNAAIRENAGHPEMFFIYERVAYEAKALAPNQPARINLQHRSLQEALRADPRWFMIETADLPREDGIHLTQSMFHPEQAPNTGAERFARATVRVLKKAERLSQLSYDARMLAMRLVDQGLDLSEEGFQACEAFAAAPGFQDLLSLTIPRLTGGENAVEQSALRRCNLLVHRGPLDAPAFVTEVPQSIVAECTSGADVAQLKALIGILASALGASDEIVVR